jgi:hypothetical protein
MRISCSERGTVKTRAQRAVPSVGSYVCAVWPSLPSQWIGRSPVQNDCNRIDIFNFYSLPSTHLNSDDAIQTRNITNSLLLTPFKIIRATRESVG